MRPPKERQLPASKRSRRASRLLQAKCRAQRPKAPRPPASNRSPTAEPPQAGEAGVGQPGEQVAAGEAAAPVEEPLQRIEIGPVEASVPTDTASAVSAEGTLAVSSPLTATAEGQTEDLSVTVEATPGAIETSEVKIKAAEAEAGTLYVAGEAPPGMLVRIYANNELVGEARASNDGTWLLEAKRDVPVGEVVFRVEAAPEVGSEARARSSRRRFRSCATPTVSCSSRS